MTQREALSILKTGANIFLTGEPGSGKTFVVNDFVRSLRACGIEPSITAATGIAATHISGMTLHSWSGIGVADSLSQADVDRIASREHINRRIAKAKVLIIDEVSMLSASVFEAVDAVCREVRRSDAPFGGLTVLLVGDFFQLPPVSRGRDASFAYESPVWRALNPLVCYLTEQYRQDDAAYLSVLSAIRRGEVEELHHGLLMGRRVVDEGPPPGAPKLYSHNADVDRLNAGELSKLPGRATAFRMTSTGREALVEGLKRGCLSPETLELKEGAAVMFTKNSPQGRFVNGTLGHIVGFEKRSGFPIVEIKNSTLVTAEPMEWQVEEDGKVRASISQVPLRLAYAMTVHKSQGLSMDAAVIDLSRAFEYGQGYVALSRVRRLDGLYLLGLNARALEVHPAVAEKDGELRAASEAARETFAALPPIELEEMHKAFVKAQGGAWPSAAQLKKARGGKGAADKAGLPGRLAETLAVVREATTLQEAAKERGLTPSTVVHHLEELAALGALVRADYAHILPDADIADEIRKILAATDGERLTPAFTALGGRYSYETIRLARLAKD
ncbi:MAG: AAA family ATPase [bacterium]|nr:AAA family ATPase [bacterium]